MRSRGRAYVRLLLFAGCFTACDSDPSTPPGTRMHERLTPEALRAMAGVSQFPKPADRAAFREAVKRHTPATLLAQGRTGFVLLEVTVDENGEVQKVTAVPSPSGVVHEAVLVRRDASGREVREPMSGGDSDPALGPAAEAALREVKFIPAMRDNVAVPFTFRMSIHFTP